MRLNVDEGVGGPEAVDAVREIEAEAEGDADRLGCGLAAADPRVDGFFSDERRGWAERLDVEDAARGERRVRELGGSLLSRRE